MKIILRWPPPSRVASDLGFYVLGIMVGCVSMSRDLSYLWLIPSVLVLWIAERVLEAHENSHPKGISK